MGKGAQEFKLFMGVLLTHLFFCMRINLAGIFWPWTGRFRVKYGEKVMAVAVQASTQGTKLSFKKHTQF